MDILQQVWWIFYRNATRELYWLGGWWAFSLFVAERLALSSDTFVLVQYLLI
jgi:hypothetical protein